MDNLNIHNEIKFYQNANNNAESIIANFVVRNEEYNAIIETLFRHKPKDSMQHELILGRRGSGKSTLLKRIQAEIEQNPKLKDKYIAINLAEEQANIFRLLDLWEETLSEIKNKLNIDKELRAFNEFKNEEQYARYLYTQIHETLTHHKKKTILLIDNIDRILESSSFDSQLLRENLLNYNDLKIIGGSTKLTEHFWKYDQPFYDFFRIHRLRPLPASDIKILLTHWATVLNLPQINKFIEGNPGKLEAIRILTDGLPRTLLFFIQLLVQKINLDGYEYLQGIMDKMTPLYQERLNHLSPAHRKIVLNMAFIWEACSTKQLSEACKMESKLVSANLKQLLEYGIIDKIETGKKNHFYRISERFFNMWLIVTQGNPSEKRKAKWLTVFLENWYTPSEIQSMAIEQLENLRGGVKNDHRYLPMTKALSQSKYISSETQNSLIDISREKGIDKFAMMPLPPKVSEIEEEISKLIEDKNWKTAFAKCKEIYQEDDGRKFLIMGSIYNMSGDLQKAEQYYLQAFEKENKTAMFNLGFLYENQGNFNLAEKYYLTAIENGASLPMSNLGILYAKQNKTELAEKYFNLAIKNGDNKALFNLGYLYDSQNKFKLAEKYYLRVIEKGSIKAMNNLGVLYDRQNKFKMAEKYYLMAIENGDKNAIINLSFEYFERNLNAKTALKYVEEAKSLATFTEESDFLIYYLIKLWNGRTQNLESEILSFLQSHSDFDFAFLITYLLIFYQNNLVNDIFRNEEIGQKFKDKYVVIYYVSQVLNSRNPKEINRIIPPEINSTVNESMTFIKEKQEFYFPERKPL